ncbi:homocysteine S-methyltransferase family protein [Ancylobacter sonchi]|uniref:homocysteine S-methyltransferase family protein n=1 Tax=Ancylobacter sonchi TaxID=1937790 RepID=UPI001BD1E5B0|nr:homocysteine S-methyltransferase family protein [Ancylobacter sonchi]MBS7535979.1 homocysteine S-methyltransferase family protein [Ancylobacter sonchi]
MTATFDFDRPLLLDGGTGIELLKRRVPILTDLWSATALLLAPQTVQSVHADFIRAGADVVTTNTYGILRDRLTEGGLGERYAELNRLAGELANRARDEVGKEVAIAGSLPPLSRSYRPELVLPFEELLPRYREQAELLAPYVDFYICETMSSSAEALAAATAAVEIGKPVWVAFSLHEDHSGRLWSGETVTEAVEALAHLPIAAFLANCCQPESIDAALGEFGALGKPFGAYANAFKPGLNKRTGYKDRKLDPGKWEEYENQSAPLRDDLPPQVFADHARHWRAGGARIFGGCCGASPEHIAQLRWVVDEIAS